MLLYKDCVAFELTMTTHLLHHDFEIVTVAPEPGPLLEWGGLHFAPQHLLGEVRVEDYEALIIPGGKWELLLQTAEVTTLIQQANEQGKLIGAICAAPIHLAKAGVLKSRRFTTSLTPNEDPTHEFDWENYVEEAVVVDRNVVTAKGFAFIDFAIAVCDQLKLFNNDEEREQYRKHYKNV